MLNKGRVCMKSAGRDRGICVILDEKEGRYLVAGPAVRKRWVSGAHLEPLASTIKVDSEEEAIKELEKISG